MSLPGRWFTFWRITFLICLALLVSGFAPEKETAHAVLGEQSIYSIQRGTPAAIPNFIDLAAGCNWSGIGGQVFDQAGAPMIKISGMLDGHQVLEYVNTGSSQRFGSGGFDLKLADRPITSQTLKLQLLNPGGARLSAPFVLRTFGDCQENLLVVNLTPISVENVIYFPTVPRY